jgi:hypothetical protein
MRITLKGVAAAVALLLAASASAAPASRAMVVEVPASSACPNGAALIEMLRSDLPRWQVSPGSARSSNGMAVTIEPSGSDRLSLRLFDQGRLVEQRMIDFTPEACPDLPRTIALIVKVWVRALPGLSGRLTLPQEQTHVATSSMAKPSQESVAKERPSALRIPTPASMPTTTTVVQSTPPIPEKPTRPEQSSEPLVATTAQNVSVPSPVQNPSTAATPPPPISTPISTTDSNSNSNAPPAPTLAPTSTSMSTANAASASASTSAPTPTLLASAYELGPLEPAAPTVPPTTPSETVTAPKPDKVAANDSGLGPVHLELFAGGGAMASPADGAVASSVAPSVGLRVDLGLGSRFGLQLGGGWDGTLTHGLGSGSVSVERQMIGLDFRATLFPLESTSSRILLLAGPALQRLDGRGSGYTTTDEKTDVVPGWELTAFWAQSPTNGLSVWAGPSARGWAWKDSFDVDHVGTVVTSPQFWLGAVVGLGYQPF